MPRLKSREKFPPGGFQYFQPESQWNAPQNASFEVVVDALIKHRQGNPYLVEKHGWSVDRETVRNEIDSFTARRCEQFGWNDYIFSGAPDPAPPPKSMPPPTILQKLGSVAGGAENLVEWIDSGAEAVSSELANTRAKICSDCPQNGKGDFSRYFTVPVSEAIRHRLNQRQGMNLNTAYDDQLNVCEACLCPLKLKVHFKLERILPHMDAETRARLDPRCWILKGT